MLKALHNLIFRRFIYVYDAGYFGLIYSIKAMIALSISGAICYFLLGADVLIWSVMMAMYVFFLNGFKSNKDMDWKYLVLFVAFVCTLIPTFGIFDESLWLILLSSILAFSIGVSEVYDSDLPKVLNLALVNALVATIYVSSHLDVPLWHSVLAAFIGGSVSIFVRLFVSFGEYGRFIQVQFVLILMHLANMSKSIGSKDYSLFQSIFINHLPLLKSKLTSQSAKIKDTHSIKNHKRALFYLYKLESVCYTLDILHDYFKQHDSALLHNLRDEITQNLRELSSIFFGKKPNISKASFLKASQDIQDTQFLNALKIFYSKIESFTRLSSLQSQAFVENTKTKTLQSMYQELKTNPLPFFYGITYASAMSIAMFIAQFFHINHGAWIALGVMTMMNQNIDTIKTLGKDSILGSFMGLVLGVLLVVFGFGHTWLYVIFVINLFLVIYFKSYPFMLWSLVLMLELVLMFALVDDNFIELILYRFGDILFGFLIAFLTAKIIYPRYSADELIPKLKSTLQSLSTLTLDLEQNKQHILQGQNQLIRNFDELSLLIRKNKDNNKRYPASILQQFDTLQKHFLQLKNLSIMLCEKIQSISPQDTLLLKNDLKALRVRYDMLCALLDSKPYYFSTDEDERFLLKDTQIYPSILHIFESQNHIYVFLHIALKK
ncbi:FUSC family protein [Helicobacter labetoulli]|uniref:FUSC family protein n=1 Tax=Helicobacter labetoulli TaxID=2315333 RepID=UPI000EF685B4|nr:FUSC family protein [Helicobacter labetoulli]